MLGEIQGRSPVELPCDTAISPYYNKLAAHVAWQPKPPKPSQQAKRTLPQPLRKRHRPSAECVPDAMASTARFADAGKQRWAAITASLTGMCLNDNGDMVTAGSDGYVRHGYHDREA